MFKIAVLFVALSVFLMGCSTSSSGVNESVGMTNAGTALAEEAAPTASTPQIAMPFSMEIASAPAGENTRITVKIAYHSAIGTPPILTLSTTPNHGIIGASRVELPAGNAGERVESSFILTGENPEIEAILRYEESGFGIEMRESYPIANAQKRAREKKFETRTPLPHPIEFDGQTIETGIEVKPQ